MKKWFVCVVGHVSNCVVLCYYVLDGWKLWALKQLVRLQTLVRGHRVKRQTNTTLQVVETFVCLQAQIRVCHVQMSKEGQVV